MKTKILLLISALTLAATSQAAIATFDSFAEGAVGTTFTDGGITFSNLDQQLPSSTPVFTIDNASGTLTGMAGFSPANTLNFGGYVPGPDSGFGRFYSMSFGTGTQASSASLNVFSADNDPNSTLTLEGIRGGLIVNSSTITLPTDLAISDQVLALGNGVYDSFRLQASSSTNQGTVFTALDGVTVNPVPEPASCAALSLGALAVLRRRKRA